MESGEGILEKTMKVGYKAVIEGVRIYRMISIDVIKSKDILQSHRME